MDTAVKVLNCGYNVVESRDLYINRPNGTGDFIIIIFLARMEVAIKGSVNIVEPNSVVLFTPDCAETIRGLDAFANSYSHFTGEGVMEFLTSLNIPLNTIITPGNCDSLNDLFKHLEIQLILKQKFWEYETAAQLSQILIALTRRLEAKVPPTGEYEELKIRFQKVRIAIHTDLERQWMIRDMAGLTGFGKTRFYHYYKAFFRISPKNDLINSRLDNAKYLLTNKALTIKQIAAMSGFENICHFTRLFKKRFNVNPSRY